MYIGFFFQKWARRAEAENVQKKQLYLKLSHKGISSLYSKGLSAIGPNEA